MTMAASINDTTAIPIVFIHRGNSLFLKYALHQARLLNPHNPIILIGDKTNALQPVFVQHYLIDNYADNAQAFQKIYQHQSPNPFDYELFCFQRWFILQQFVDRFNILQFVYLDSDVLLYCQVDQVMNTLKTDMTVCKEYGPCYTFVKNAALLKDYCRFIVASFVQEQEKKMTRAFMAKFADKGTPGLSDMVTLGAFASINHIDDIGKEGLPIYFDHNINCPNVYAYNKKTSLKKIYWLNNQPHLYNIYTKQYVRSWGLHFQGGAKSLMFLFVTPIIRRKLISVGDLMTFMWQVLSRTKTYLTNRSIC